MDAILSFLKEFDISKILPDMTTFMGRMEGLTRLAVLLGPLVLGLLGVWYYFKPQKNISDTVGFRSRVAMRSIHTWRYAQRMAGLIWMYLGGGLFLLMLIISLFYGLMGAMGMVIVALISVILEVGLMIASYVVINSMISKFYDKDGNPLPQAKK